MLFSFCLFFFVLKLVGELRSLLKGKVAEILSLQQSFASVEQKKDTVEQQLGDLVSSTFIYNDIHAS